MNKIPVKYLTGYFDGDYFNWHGTWHKLHWAEIEREYYIIVN